MKPRKLMGVWLDTSKAVLVTLEGKSSDVKTLESGIETQERIEGETNQTGRFGNQFVEDERAKEKKIREMESKFLERVMGAVASSDQLLVFGPAHMKTRFEKLFEQENGPTPNLRAVEPADSMTDNQIAAHVREFYGKDTGIPANL
ncbi:MAG TPA: hypothetical protein VMM38_03545 [Aridibacter sp.]|nr:hypothetical protein [Aridibacter sp.]